MRDVARFLEAVRDAGVAVSSVCRGGMFPAATRAERESRIDDNRRAVDEAAALGADVLVLVCGAAPDKDIGAARQVFSEAELLEFCSAKLSRETMEALLRVDPSDWASEIDDTRTERSLSRGQARRSRASHRVDYPHSDGLDEGACTCGIASVT